MSVLGDSLILLFLVVFDDDWYSARRSRVQYDAITAHLITVKRVRQLVVDSKTPSLFHALFSNLSNRY